MRLKKLRQSVPMTMQAVADELSRRGHNYKSGRAVIDAWEGGRSSPPARLLADYAEILGVSIEDLVEAITAERRNSTCS